MREESNIKNKIIHIMHVLNEYGPGSWAVDLSQSYSPRFKAIIVSLKGKKLDIIPNSSLVAVHDLGINSYVGIQYIVKIIHIINKYKIDIIHTHHNFSGALVRIIAKFKGIPVVDTEHNIHKYFRPTARFINGITLPLAEAIVCVSPSVERSFLSWERKLVNKTNVHIIPNGVNFYQVNIIQRNRELFLEEYGFPRDSYVMLNVGMLIKQKNQEFLLEVVSGLKQRGNNNVKLLILGEGNLRNMLEKKIKVLGLTDYVRMPGLVPRKKVYEALKSCDLFIFSSLWEGLPLALLECLAAGTPVLASDIFSHRDIVNLVQKEINNNSLEKVLLSIDSTDDWVRHIETKIHKSDTSVFPPKYIQNIFSYNKMVQNYEELYISILQRKVCI